MAQKDIFDQDKQKMSLLAVLQILMPWKEKIEIPSK